MQDLLLVLRRALTGETPQLLAQLTLHIRLAMDQSGVPIVLDGVVGAT